MKQNAVIKKKRQFINNRKEVSKMKNNKKINILLAVIMIFTITVVPTNATVHVQKEETIETKLLDKIVDSGLSQESIDSKTIKKISSKEAKAIVNFEDDSKNILINIMFT